MGGFGVGEILVIGVVLTLLFGAGKIPTIARGLGEGIRNFKGEMAGKNTDGSEPDTRASGDGERSKPRRED